MTGKEPKIRKSAGLLDVPRRQVRLEVSLLMAEGSKDGKESEDGPGGTGGD